MIVAFLAVVLAVALYAYGTRRHDYWRRRGVPQEPALPLLGTEARRYLGLRSATQLANDVYRAHPRERFVGGFRGCTPTLLLRDPDLVRHVLLTDFDYFYAKGFTPSHKWMEPLLRNLFFADGDLWRLLRQRMTPAFTSGKLRAMFPLIVERAERLQARALRAAAAARPLDARDLMARYTTDFIGAVGFGLDADSLDDDHSEFRKLGTKIFEPSLRRSIVAFAKSLFPDAFKYSKFLGQELEDDFFSKQIRERRAGQPSSVRHDFLDFLLEWQEKGKIPVKSLEKFKSDGTPETVEIELDDVMVTAQAFIFFVAGFETSSSATSFTLHQLAYHPAVQRKVQEEIDRVLLKYDGKLSYDAIKEMTYLEWVLMEGMRMFPSSGILMRECVRPYTLPGTDVTIGPGVKVTVPLMALQNDPAYFDDPAEFRPERFAPEEVAKRHKFVYLPFGKGPRSCIGGRLGLMQSLAGLAALLARCGVSPAPGACRYLRSDPRAVVTQAVLGGIPLQLEQRRSSGRG